MQYLSEKQYVAFKPETVAGTPVLPTIFAPIISADIKTVLDHKADERIRGVAWKSAEMLRGFRSHEGSIVLLGDVDMLAHVFNMLMTKGATTGDGTNGYTHPFTVGDTKTYTVEVSKGAHVERYFGVRIDELKLAFNAGKLQLTLNVKALGQFSVAGVTGITGSVVTLGEDYDLLPNKGLIIGDNINVGGTICPITAVDVAGKTVTATGAPAFVAGMTVALAPQTPAFTQAADPLHMGNMLVGFGADIATAQANLTVAASQKLTDFSITLKNNLYVGQGSASIDPVVVAPRTREGQVTSKMLLETSAQRKALLARDAQAIAIKCVGKAIGTGRETLVINFPRVIMTEDVNPITVGDFIVEEQTFDVLHDATTAKAMDVSVINKNAGTTL